MAPPALCRHLAPPPCGACVHALPSEAALLEVALPKALSELSAAFDTAAAEAAAGADSDSESDPYVSFESVQRPATRRRSTAQRQASGECGAGGARKGLPAPVARHALRGAGGAPHRVQEERQLAPAPELFCSSFALLLLPAVPRTCEAGQSRWLVASAAVQPARGPPAQRRPVRVLPGAAGELGRREACAGARRAAPAALLAGCGCLRGDVSSKQRGLTSRHAATVPRPPPPAGLRRHPRGPGAAAAGIGGARASAARLTRFSARSGTTGLAVCVPPARRHAVLPATNHPYARHQRASPPTQPPKPWPPVAARLLALPRTTFTHSPCGAWGDPPLLATASPTTLLLARKVYTCFSSCGAAVSCNTDAATYLPYVANDPPPPPSHAALHPARAARRALLALLAPPLWRRRCCHALMLPSPAAAGSFPAPLAALVFSTPASCPTSLPATTLFQRGARCAHTSSRLLPSSCIDTSSHNHCFSAARDARAPTSPYFLPSSCSARVSKRS